MAGYIRLVLLLLAVLVGATLFKKLRLRRFKSNQNRAVNRDLNLAGLFSE